MSEEVQVRQRRRMREHRGFGFWVGVVLIKPLLLVLIKPRWIDGHKVPAEGGVVIAANHISHVDPFTFALFVYDQGRLPRYLAKAELFDVRLLGRLIASMGQIPVHRLSADASAAFASAVAAVRQGRAVVVYPEGTLTRQPDLWPMLGKTGAARIALAAGVPVIPVAQWGAHELLYPYAKRPSLLPRKQIWVRAGDPVPLDDLRGHPITPELAREATDRITSAITELLEQVRGETAPTPVFDPRSTGLAPVGPPVPLQTQRYAAEGPPR